MNNLITQQLNDIKNILTPYGFNIDLITSSAIGNIVIPEHTIDLTILQNNYEFNISDEIIDVFTNDEDSTIRMSFRNRDIDDSIWEKLWALRNEINNKVNDIFNNYYLQLNELNKEKTLLDRFGLLSSNYQHTNSLSSVSNWKVKVIIGNSRGSDSPDVGEFDNVGYVHIGLKTGTIVPIAKADEHHRGYDLIVYLLEQQLIPEDDYVPIHTHHDYIDANDVLALNAMKIWRQLGGPNIIIKNLNYNKENFQLTIDDYIKAEGKITINKGVLAPLGQKLIDHLKQVSTLCIESRNNPRKEKQLYKQSKIAYNYFCQIIQLRDCDQDTLDLIDQAEVIGGEQGVQKLEQLFFGFDSFKNKLHNQVRNALKPNAYNFQIQDMEAIFGDLDLANHELGSL